MIFTSRNYAIGMAHYQIAGGTRLLLLLSAAYIAGAAALAAVFSYNENWPLPPRAAAGFYTLVLVVESLLLVAVGAIRIAGCVRSDATSNMIESHRLMPVESWRAVLGYLFGTTAHLLILSALNVILLGILRPMTGVSFDDFVITQIVLASFAMFLWTFAGMGALMLKQMMPLVIMGFVFGSIFSQLLRNFQILPGVSVLLSPLLGETIFSLTGGMVSIRAALPLALAAQGAFAAIFFAGACRRYRGTYVTTLNVPLAMGLMLVWGLLSVMAMRHWESLNGRMRFGGGRASLEGQVVASLVLAAMLSIIVVYALAAWSKRHRVAPAMTALVLAGTAVVGTLSVLAAGYQDRLGLWGLSLLVIGIHVFTMYALFRGLRWMTPMSNLVTAATLLFTMWLLPILVELVRWSMLPRRADGYEFGWIGTLSPLGVLISRWTGEERPSPVVGLVFQTAVMLALAYVALQVKGPRETPVAASAKAGPAKPEQPAKPSGSWAELWLKGPGKS